MTKLETVEYNGKYSARYPTKLSLPHSLKVVSFDIYDNTSNFLKFLSCATPLRDKENSSDETVADKWVMHLSNRRWQWRHSLRVFKDVE